MPTVRTIMRGGWLAGVVFAAVLTAAPCLHAQERAAEPREGWFFTAPSYTGFSSGGAPSSFYFLGTPGTAFRNGFADYSVGHALGFGRDFGMTTEATFGVRVAEPLITNGFTPSLDPRRYVGTGPSVGLEGNKPLQSSWALEWRVGAAVLFSDRFDSAGTANALLPNYSSPGSAPVVNVDGLLGLSYWFDTASKLTLGYRADAYFKGSSAGISSTPAETADRINHGPMVRFTIQK